VAASAPAIARLVGAALLCLAASGPATPQGVGSAQAEIRAALTQWMADFNAANSDRVCGLFAPDLIAQYRGQPERDYNALCDLLKRSLNDRTKKFSYALDIKEIIVAGDLAIVRLTWTLTVRRNNAPGETTLEEPGIDVFRRQTDGSWRIFRYIAYDASP
jgi:ketosteroid isomerase-like protein